jgi:hypothetical protein
MSSTNADCVKIVFKPSSNSEDSDIIAVTVVIRGRDGETAIEQARELLKLDRAAWTVKRVIEAPGEVG